MAKKEISIIIPVYNGEKQLPTCLEKTISYCNNNFDDYEIIIAEDGSSDNSVLIINEFITKNDKVKILSFKERQGKGGALINAIPTAKKEYIGFMDVDLAANPSEFNKFLLNIDDYDIIIGSRILRGDLPPIQRPFYRTFFSYAYSKLFRVLFRIPIYDPQCGMKLFRKEIASKLFSEIETTAFAFDSELLVKACLLNLRIKETPINWKHDSASQVSVITQIHEMSQDLLSIWYEAHLLWEKNKKVYPQKRGTLLGKVLFKFLSVYKKPRKK